MYVGVSFFECITRQQKNKKKSDMFNLNEKKQMQNDSVKNEL